MFLDFIFNFYDISNRILIQRKISKNINTKSEGIKIKVKVKSVWKLQVQNATIPFTNKSKNINLVNDHKP